MCYPCGDWDLGGCLRLSCCLRVWEVSGIESENPPWLGEHRVGVDAPDPTGCSLFFWEEWWDGDETFIPGHRSSLEGDR